LAKLLNGGRRITMMCGAGCAGAHAEVVAQRALNAPHRAFFAWKNTSSTTTRSTSA
jgi:hypothetical protein